MLMIAGDSPVPTTNYETTIALRGTELLQPYIPKYLLAPEVAVLLHYLTDERQRMLFAQTITPENLQLDGPLPCIRLRTLKQRQQGRGRLSADEKSSAAARCRICRSASPLSGHVQNRSSTPSLQSAGKQSACGCNRRSTEPGKRGLNLRSRPSIQRRCATVLPCICFSTTCRRKSSRPIWGMNAMKARRCI